MSIKEILRILFAVLTGSLLYIVLILIPIIGPLITGLIAGWIAKSKPKTGFFIGVISGIIGFLFLIFIAFPTWNLNLNFFVWWIFLIWNLIAFLFTGVGAILGSMMSTTADFFSKFDRSERRKKEDIYVHEPETPIFVVCPNCGMSNPEDKGYCSSCGTPLRRG